MKNMWIILTISAALFNALWTALSKGQLSKLTPYQFTLLVRLLTLPFLVPPFLYDFRISVKPIFWLTAIGAGTLETIGIWAQSVGVKKDFYSTYSLSNTSILITLIIAPHLLPEKINLILVFGAIFMISGGVIFWNLNRRFSVYGIIRAFCIALASIFAKIAIGYSSALTYPFIAFTIGVWLMALARPFREKYLDWHLFKSFTKKLLPLAVVSACAIFCFYSALQIAPVTRVNPMSRINLLFGFIFSYFMLKEREHLRRKLLAGIFVIIGSALISMSISEIR